MIFSNMFFTSSTTYRVYTWVHVEKFWTKFDQFNLTFTVKPVYNDHPRDSILAVVYRWSLFRDHIYSKCDQKMVVVMDSWSLWTVGHYGQLVIMVSWSLWTVGRYRHVVAIRRWSLSQVWLYTRQKEINEIFGVLTIYN
jgi:hypothetical protein